MATMKVLIVGGGGGGGTGGAGYGGGGGGAGGYLYYSAFDITSNTYHVWIGSGGNVNNNGGYSKFGTYTAQGGGFGGSSSLPQGSSGASGGGARSGTTTRTTATSGSQGNIGGAGNANSNYGAGGGGGAGSAGQDGLTSYNSYGGAGVANDISGTSTYYAGGGGGSFGPWGNPANPNGGIGGGGNGGDTGTASTAGTANTGGGGGGGWNGAVGSAGGSGIVIVSYLTSEWGTCTGGTITTNGSYTVHTFTSSGTFVPVAKVKKIAGVEPISALSLDSTSVGNGGGTSSTTLTWNHTVGSGTDRALIIFTPISQAVNPTSVKYGGTSLTQVVYMNNGAKAGLYILTEPPVGTASCEIVFDASVPWLYAGAASFFGVDQSVPVVDNTSWYGTAQNRTFNIFASYANSYILECMGDYGSVNTPASGQTRITYDNRISAYDTGITGGFNTQSWTGSSSQVYAWVGTNLKSTRQHFGKVAGVGGREVKKIAGMSPA